jgi:hypothetical protein
MNTFKDFAEWCNTNYPSYSLSDCLITYHKLHPMGLSINLINEILDVSSLIDCMQMNSTEIKQFDIKLIDLNCKGLNDITEPLSHFTEMK